MSQDTVQKFNSVIDIAFGQLSEMISWCNRNCASDWDYSVIDTAGLAPGKYEFHFTSESDYINFVLWKT